MDAAELGRALLTIARSAIAQELGLSGLDGLHHERLQQPSATFVTLKQSGGLRGCVGSLQAVRPLGVDVRDNAIAAAFRDPRFCPLAAAELEQTSIEVSLLSVSERIEARDEKDLVSRLRPRIDGLVLEYGGRRATFLPQVWEAIADPRDFLGALKLKAGLPQAFWSPGVNVSRYAVTRWTDLDMGETRQ